MKYTRAEFSQDACSLAKGLIGAGLFTRIDGRITGGIVVEAEAYMGKADRAAHSSRGDPAGRTRVLYGPKGYAYVYLIYGKYHCLNIACGPAGEPQCVLLRSLYPTVGVEVMEDRRGIQGIAGLCDGPGKLCIALGITGACYGADLTGERIWLEKGEGLPIKITQRVGVEYAGADAALPYRFVAEEMESLGIKDYPRDYRRALRLKDAVEEGLLPMPR